MDAPRTLPPNGAIRNMNPVSCHRYHGYSGDLTAVGSTVDCLPRSFAYRLMPHVVGFILICTMIRKRQAYTTPYAETLEKENPILEYEYNRYV